MCFSLIASGDGNVDGTNVVIASVFVVTAKSFLCFFSTPVKQPVAARNLSGVLAEVRLII
jgi:hypothetical protein